MAKQYTLASDSFQQISQLIISGQLKPGEKLKGEYLKQLLGVGLSPIREALARLATTRLVEFKDKTGFRVTRFSQDEAQDVLISHAKIECLLLKDAILYGNSKWEAQIMASLYSLSKIESNSIAIEYDYWAQLNDEFHNALLAAAANSQMLWQIRTNCEKIKDWLNNLVYIDRRQKLIKPSHTEHALLAKLCIARKSEDAIHLLYRHLTKGIEQVISNLVNRKLID